MQSYELAVIGAGPGGYVAAIRAAQLGLKVALIDRWNLDADPAPGGTCLNVGCIPSKALLESSHLFERIRTEASLHGIKTAAPSLDIGAMQTRKSHIVGTLQQGILGLLRSNNVTFIHGDATFVSETEIQVSDAKGESTAIEAANTIIATGSKPIELPMARVGASIGDSSHALSFEAPPAELAIIGGGVIGLELGSVWRRLGTRVTIFEAASEFLPSVDRELAASALKTFKSQGLEILLDTKVIDTEDDEDYVVVTIERDGETAELEFDRLIVAAGRQPNTQGLGLENIGLHVDERGFIPTDINLRTAVGNIFAIGDCTHGPMLAHKASHDGIKAAEVCAGIGYPDSDAPEAPIPWVIYTWPEIAWFGPTEQALEASGEHAGYKVATFPLAANGRAHTLDSAQGLIKVITTATGAVLAMHIFSPHASELIGQGTLASLAGLSADELKRDIKAHPSLSEGLHEAVLGLEGSALHFYQA